VSVEAELPADISPQAAIQHVKALRSPQDPFKVYFLAEGL
jgi:hypothetical protein